VDELVDPRYIGHSSQPGTETRGIEGYRHFVMAMRTAFPDLEVTVEDQIAEGDRVVSRWRATGTHLGVFFGVPPSGRRASTTGITIERIEHGKTIECWTNSDDLGLLSQIGAIPAVSAS
jgi:steroid delta-isomerase-like uncharacterized protein